MKQYFLRANLMCTINDFPIYSIMSGWSTSGYLACPSCAENTVSEWLYKFKKICYMRHERFKKDPLPQTATGQNVLSSVGNFNVIFGLNNKNPTDTQIEKNIFFDLSYCKDNLIRYNLD